MLFKTVMADFPWPEQGSGKCKRGADRWYPLMSAKEILAACEHVKPLLDPEGCHLYLWVTNNFLELGMQVLKAMGFRYVTMITWVKTKSDEPEDEWEELTEEQLEGKDGLGQYYRGRTEHCLFGVQGHLPYRQYERDGKMVRAQGSTALPAPRGAHSVKPEKLAVWAERVSHGPRLEMFAREPRPNWTVMSNDRACMGRLGVVMCDDVVQGLQGLKLDHEQEVARAGQ